MSDHVHMQHWVIAGAAAALPSRSSGSTAGSDDVTDAVMLTTKFGDAVPAWMLVSQHDAHDAG